MLLIHTSDWHLGLALHGASLFQAQESMLNALCELARTRNADALLLSGDVFDRVNAPKEAMDLYGQTMARFLLELKLPVFLIAGNHDSAPRLTQLKEVLRPMKLYMAGVFEPDAPPAELDDCAVFLAPYFQLDQLRFALKDESLSSLAQGAQQAMERMKARLVPNKKNILLAHAFAAGGTVASSDRVAQVGGAARIPLEVFAGFDYVAMGHLHRAQSLAIPGGGLLRYCGTPLPYAFDEAGEHSVTLYNTATGAVEAVPLPCPYSLVTLRGETQKVMAQAEELSKQPQTQLYIRAELTDAPLTRAVQTKLTALLPGLLELRGTLALPPQRTTITAQEAAKLDPITLARRYMKDIENADMDAEQEGWLREALDTLP